MKAILVFNLDVIEDKQAFKVASNAENWYLVCFELDRELKDIIKYREASKEFYEVRDRLYEIMLAHGVSLEDIS